jgi:hypothetical protein
MCDRNYTKTGSKELEGRSGKPFGHHIGVLLPCRYVEDAQFAGLDTLTYEVDVQLDMLRALVMHRVGRHVHRRDVITKHHSGLADKTAEFTEELPKPDTLRCYICHRPVLRLCA